MTNLRQPVFDDVSHIPLCVSKSVETGVDVGHCATDESVQVVVALGVYFGLGEMGDAGFELVQGDIEQIEAVIKSSLFEGGKVAEFLTEAGAVGGGGSDLVGGVVEEGGDELWDGFGGEIWEGGEGGDTEVRVEGSLACRVGYLEVWMDWGWG